MQGNVNIPDSTITSALTFRQLVLMNMQQLTNFPYIEKDFDALTDYELLCLVVKFLNDVIANQNEQNDSITNMYNAFLALQTYVNNTKDTLEDAFNTLDDYVRNYFENLDVQEEINNKLDAMAEDGSLISLIADYLPEVYPEMYGAVGDGETDDTTAIQTAINTANLKKSKINFMNKTYKTTSGLNIYNGMEVNGNNATIKNETNSPIITSSGVVSGINIHDLTLVGANNELYTNNNGIDLVCYYSKFNNLLISLCYSGIYIHHDGASGTLVENRLSNIRANNYYQYGIYLGANGNNKLTDGFLNNVICNGNNESNTNQYGLFIGSSAGWVINGVHIYGKNYNAIACSNSYFTSLNNIYIESFSNYGLAMGSSQTGANITNVQIRHNNVENDGTAIRIEQASYLPATTHAGNLTNIRILRGSSTLGKSIVVTGANSYNATNVIIDGDSRTLLNDCSGLNFGYNGLIDKDDQLISKQKNGVVDAGIKAYKYKGFNPSTTTLEIQLPTFTQNNQQAIVELTGIGGQYTSQSGLFYKGLIQAVRNNSANIVVRIHDIDNTLFTSAPTITVDQETNIATITIAPESTTYGIMYYDYYFPNL